MYIKKLKIDAFGVLRNREIELSPTLNIIEGENESGKSALAMFIKFIFYGLSGKAAGGELSERRRYVNWDTGTAGGYMILEENGRLIRIERNLSVSGVDDGAKTKETVRESVRIYDMDADTLIHRGEIPGEALLGVPENIFMNTVFVRQIDGTRPAGSSILSSIENLLFSADESVGTDKALASLEESRRQLLHKNGGGGALYEAKARRSALAAELQTALSQGNALLGAEEELSQADEECAQLDEQIKKQEKICAYGEISLLKRRFDTLHSAGKKLTAMQEEIAAKKQSGVDRAYLAQLEECEKHISDYTMILDKLDAEETTAGEELRAASEKSDKIEAETERVLTQAEGLLSRIRSMTAAALTLFFFAILAGIGGWLLSMLHVSIFAVPIAAAAVLAALGVLCLILRSRAGTELADLLREWGAVSTGDLAKAIAESMGGSAGTSALQMKKSQLEAAASDARAKRRDEVHRAFVLAERVVETPDTQSDEDDERQEAALASLSAAREEASRICAETDAMQREADTLAGRLSLLKEQLSGKDEAAIRRAFAENIKSVEGRIASGLDTARLEAARRELQDMQENRRRSVERHHQLDTHVAASRATQMSPAALAEEISRLDARIEEMTEEHEACCLAIETLERASASMRAGILPQIVQQACASANRISDGRFEAIGIDHSLSMSFTRGGQTRGIEYLSEGTKDLAYISLRRALSQALFGKACPPLIYDESFARVDENRLARILDMLNTPDDGNSQSIVLSCRRLEAELASENGGAAVIRL